LSISQNLADDLISSTVGSHPSPRFTVVIVNSAYGCPKLTFGFRRFDRSPGSFLEASRDQPVTKFATVLNTCRSR
jgi:hypothetical protein